MADSDFFSFDFPSFSLGGVGGLDTSFLDQYSSPSSPSYDYPLQETTEFNFQMPQSVLQGGGWDQSFFRQISQEPTFNLGGGSLAQPGVYSALFGGGQPAEPDYYGGLYSAYGAGGYGSGGVVGYDPSTGKYFDTAGNAVEPQAGGPTTGPLTPGGRVAAAQGAVPGGQPSAGGGSGGAGGGWAGAIGDFLKSPLGGLFGSAAVGAAGLGAGRLLAGDMPRPPQPSLAPGSPINAAGQNTMAGMFADQAAREAGYQAGQAPGYEAIRNQAMTLIPGQLNPVTVENYQDPVQAALRAELMSTLQGGASPLAEENIRKSWDTLQNTMFRRLGPDWELSSAGQEALQSFNRNATIARDESKRGTVAAYSPLEQERARFGYQAPVEKARALGGEQRAYVDTLARTSALGRMDPYQLQGALGGSPDQYRGMLTGLGFQGQQAGYGAQQQERRDIMGGVGGIAGTVAGQVGSLGQTDRLTKAIRELNGGTLPTTTSGSGVT